MVVHLAQMNLRNLLRVMLQTHTDFTMDSTRKFGFGASGGGVGAKRAKTPSATTNRVL